MDRRVEGVLVIFVDLDDFKTVNDVHGHAAGDEVLRVVAARLAHALRPTDDVGRYGGDELVAVCCGAHEGSESAIVARIEAALEAPVVLPSGSWRPRASIGVARPRAGERPDDVVGRADGRMYLQKRTRRSAQEPVAELAR
jgi:diguanylate cyclase (GGDEF)-like protein